jgi:hypothetical protein
MRNNLIRSGAIYRVVNTPQTATNAINRSTTNEGDGVSFTSRGSYQQVHSKRSRTGQYNEVKKKNALSLARGVFTSKGYDTFSR